MRCVRSRACSPSITLLVVTDEPIQSNPVQRYAATGWAWCCAISLRRGIRSRLVGGRSEVRATICGSRQLSITQNQSLIRRHAQGIAVRGWVSLSPASDPVHPSPPPEIADDRDVSVQTRNPPTSGQAFPYPFQHRQESSPGHGTRISDSAPRRRRRRSGAYIKTRDSSVRRSLEIAGATVARRDGRSG
jgi:hypothetical protein